MESEDCRCSVLLESQEREAGQGGLLVNDTMFAAARSQLAGRLRAGIGARRFSTSQPPKRSEGTFRGPITWASLALVGISFGGMVSFYTYHKNRTIEKAKAKNSRVIGKALLGGQFTLVDENGLPVTDASFRKDGHTHALLYFGFTYCPDICPAELIKMKEIVETLDQDPEIGPVVLPVFITCDPKRDGIAQVRHYIKDFHPRMIGLTGTPGQIATACKAYRVYHSIADQDLEDEDDYLVDHSIVMYLIGPDGMFLEFFTQLTEIDEAVATIKDRILNPEQEDP